MRTMRSSRGGRIATAIAAVCTAGGLGFIAASIDTLRGGDQVPGGTGVSMTSTVKATGSHLRESVSSNGIPIRGRPQLPRSRPVALDIPSIDVNSPVRFVGKAEDGTLETPAPGPHYDEAAWYRHSPTPGSLGPAILLGHVDSAIGGPSVFFRLGEVRPGDRVSVTRADDSVAVFIVDRVKNYAKAAFPTEIVYGNIDHAGLRILTCGGDFDDATGHYVDNIVVFASLRGTATG